FDSGEIIPGMKFANRERAHARKEARPGARVLSPKKNFRGICSTLGKARNAEKKTFRISQIRARARDAQAPAHRVDAIFSAGSFLCAGALPRSTTHIDRRQTRP